MALITVRARFFLCWSSWWKPSNDAIYGARAFCFSWTLWWKLPNDVSYRACAFFCLLNTVTRTTAWCCLRCVRVLFFVELCAVNHWMTLCMVRACFFFVELCVENHRMTLFTMRARFFTRWGLCRKLLNDAIYGACVFLCSLKFVLKITEWWYLWCVLVFRFVELCAENHRMTLSTVRACFFLCWILGWKSSNDASYGACVFFSLLNVVLETIEWCYLRCVRVFVSLNFVMKTIEWH